MTRAFTGTMALAVAGRTVLALVGLGGVVWAIAGLRAEFGGAAQGELVRRIETGAGFDWRRLSEFDAIDSSDKPGWACLPRYVRQVVSVRLAAVDAAVTAGVPDGVDSALRDARSSIVAALGCVPTDGNLWLRLAMVEARREGPTARVKQWLESSYAMAPNEPWIVHARISFAAKLVSAGAVERGLFERDVGEFVRWARTVDIEELAARMPQAALPFLGEAVDRLPEPRRTKLLYGAGLQNRLERAMAGDRSR